jgi:cysteine-rich repeat protein
MKKLLSLIIAVGMAGSAGAGAMFISGDDADDNNHCQATRCGALYPRVLSLLMRECLPVPTQQNGILAIGVNPTCNLFGCNPSIAQTSLEGWNDPANGGPGANITIIRDPAVIASVRFEDYTVVYLPSYSGTTQGGITNTQLAAVNARGADLKAYVNDSNGRILALTEQGANAPYGWLPNPLTYVTIQDDDIDPTPEMDTQFPGSGANATNMNHAAYHSAWTGPDGFSGLYVLAVSKQTRIPDPSGLTPWIDAPVIVGGCNLRITIEICDNGTDDDGDGQTDENDPDCWVCGNHRTDPGEECDDGNVVSGDGCDGACRIEVPQPCSVIAAPIYPLKGVKVLPDAVWSWPLEAAAVDGYRVYQVAAKTELDWTLPQGGANGRNPNATLSCDTTDVATLTCTAAGAVPAPTSPLFYQVIGVCGLTEGAN